jgi:hypothetical protein
MSLGGARIMGRGRDKDTRDKDKEREREQREKQVELARAHTVRTGMIANNPGRWNRDMVVGIMGPPAERR